MSEPSEPASRSSEPPAPPAAGPARRWAAALPRIFEALAVNAVPIWGLVYKGWSLSTMLLLYWLENLLSTFFVGARIWLHRRLTHKRGHWTRVEMKATVNGRPVKVRTTVLGAFVGSNLIFGLAHGIFVVVLVFAILPQRPRLADVGRGVRWLLIAMTVSFLIDALTIRRQPFAWIRQRVDGALGRMLVVHFTLIGGIMFIAMTNREASLFYVFVLIKVLFDLASALPLSRPIVTDVCDTSAERRRADEEVVRRG